ncbi:MAG: hypothetical protein LH628_13830, partial [Microcoleus sp. CAN_BIN18]|nr:hypothetical protein [Microcoleus sp. CAN_BIN18]
ATPDRVRYISCSTAGSRSPTGPHPTAINLNYCPSSIHCLVSSEDFSPVKMRTEVRTIEPQSRWFDRSDFSPHCPREDSSPNYQTRSRLF